MHRFIGIRSGRYLLGCRGGMAERVKIAFLESSLKGVRYRGPGWDFFRKFLPVRRALLFPAEWGSVNGDPAGAG